jgi:hypothetical protein
MLGFAYFACLNQTEESNFRCSLCFILHTKLDTLQWFVSVLSRWWPEFYPKPVHVVFIASVVTLGQFSLQVLRFYPVTLILPILLTRIP